MSYHTSSTLSSYKGVGPELVWLEHASGSPGSPGSLRLGSKVPPAAPQGAQRGSRVHHAGRVRAEETGDPGRDLMLCATTRMPFHSWSFGWPTPPDLASGGDRRRRRRQSCPCTDELGGPRVSATRAPIVPRVGSWDCGRRARRLPSATSGDAAVVVAGNADERMANFGAEARAGPLIPSRTSACRAHTTVDRRLCPGPRTLLEGLYIGQFDF